MPSFSTTYVLLSSTSLIRPPTDSASTSLSTVCRLRPIEQIEQREPAIHLENVVADLLHGLIARIEFIGDLTDQFLD